MEWTKRRRRRHGQLQANKLQAGEKIRTVLYGPFAIGVLQGIYLQGVLCTVQVSLRQCNAVEYVGSMYASSQCIPSVIKERSWNMYEKKEKDSCR